MGTSPALCFTSNTDIEMFGIVAFEDVDVFHGGPSSLRRLQRRSRLAEARLRPWGYDAAAFATKGLAEPKQASPAKAGGARRDRTADLLHAMQALSQLSYGPLDRSRAPWATRGFIKS